MKKAGQVVVFRFPQTDLEEGKLRPALLLGKLPGEFDDWLICMISSQISLYIAGFDEMVKDSGRFYSKRVKGYKCYSGWTFSGCFERNTSWRNWRDFTGTITSCEAEFIQLAV